MERVTSIDSGNSRAKNATSLAVVILIFIIATILILFMLFERSLLIGLFRLL